MSEETTPAPLLQVRDLAVRYGGDHAPATVDRVGFDVSRNETVALVGQSGSGKSTTIHAILRLLPRSTAVTGAVDFDGTDLLSLRRRSFKGVLRSSVGFVPQDPVTSLNPVRRIGSQVEEALRLAHGRSRQGAPSVVDVLARVGIPAPERVARLYPSQLSGGLLQRVLIGIAVIGEPRLLVADEPTSALDVSVQRTVLDLLDELKAQLGLSLLLITHDLSLARERADRVVVLDQGRVVESGPVERVLSAPASPFTRRLVADVPAYSPDKYATLKGERTAGGQEAAVELRELRRTFGSGHTRVVALDGLSLSVRKGTTHALVGESGSGKTTAARILMGLESRDGGEVVVAGKPLQRDVVASVRAARRHLQLVYQNPFASLDPRWTVRRLVREPLDRYSVGTARQREERVADLLDRVGLGADRADRRIGLLSGGQRQRVAIARALAIEPDVVVLDEPTSALDVTVQAQILDLLMEMQRDLGVSYLFVSHDLGVVRQIADDVTVLRAGRVEEQGRAADILVSPRSDYTRFLLDAVPGRRRVS